MRKPLTVQPVSHAPIPCLHANSFRCAPCSCACLRAQLEWDSVDLDEDKGASKEPVELSQVSLSLVLRTSVPSAVAVCSRLPGAEVLSFTAVAAA